MRRQWKKITKIIQLVSNTETRSSKSSVRVYNLLANLTKVSTLKIYKNEQKMSLSTWSLPSAKYMAQQVKTTVQKLELSSTIFKIRPTSHLDLS